MRTVSGNESKHFTLQPLAEDTFAAIAELGGYAICNSAMIDLGDQVIVFDTFVTPQAARDLRELATDRFGRTPQIVINSHFHNDHIWGNQVFAASAQILSSRRTRELIATAGKEEYKWYSAVSAEKLAALRAEYEKTGDEGRRQGLLLWIGEYGGIVEALPHLKICLPTVTFESRLQIHGGKRTAELFTFENAHTGSDTILYLPQDGVVFMSDILFTGCHPYLGDGDAEQLLKALREISRLDASFFVPGHGLVGTIEDVKLLIAYVEGCLETARSLVDQDRSTDEEIRALKIPGQFQDWLAPEFYPANLRFLCQRMGPGD